MVPIVDLPKVYQRIWVCKSLITLQLWCTKTIWWLIESFSKVGVISEKSDNRIRTSLYFAIKKYLSWMFLFNEKWPYFIAIENHENCCNLKQNFLSVRVNYNYCWGNYMSFISANGLDLWDSFLSKLADTQTEKNTVWWSMK